MSATSGSLRSENDEKKASESRRFENVPGNLPATRYGPRAGYLFRPQKDVE